MHCPVEYSSCPQLFIYHVIKRGMCPNLHVSVPSMEVVYCVHICEKEVVCYRISNIKTSLNMTFSVLSVS